MSFIQTQHGFDQLASITIGVVGIVPEGGNDDQPRIVFELQGHLRPGCGPFSRKIPRYMLDMSMLQGKAEREVGTRLRMRLPQGVGVGSATCGARREMLALSPPP